MKAEVEELKESTGREDIEILRVGQIIAARCPQCPPGGVDEFDFENTKLRLHLLLDHPESSRAAAIIQYYMINLIILATFKLILISVRDLSDWVGWDVIEWWIALSFTFEIILRVWGSHDRKAFFRDFNNIIDILAVVPFYLGFIPNIEHLRVIRIIRIIRVFRLLKLTRHTVYMKVFGETLQQCWEALSLLTVFVLVSTIVLATIEFNIEVGDWDDNKMMYMRSDGTPSPFTSIPAAMYWCLETLTTVGYGDVVPIEPLGRLFANFTMIMGILVIALPIVVIASSFGTIFVREVEKKKRIDRLVKGQDPLSAKNIDQLTKLQSVLHNKLNDTMQSLKMKKGFPQHHERYWKSSIESINSQLSALLSGMEMYSTVTAPSRAQNIEFSVSMTPSRDQETKSH